MSDDAWSGASNWERGLGRLRDVVRQRLVAEQVATLLAGLPERPLRVLDAGCGQGTQALLLAEAGHSVTGLDVSAQLLERFAAELAGRSPDVRGRVQLVLGSGVDAPSLVDGPFDLILCHGVLMYLDDVEPMLRGLTAVAARGSAVGAAGLWGARLSLLVRNGLAPAMRDGLRGQWTAASAAFDSPDYVNRLGLAAHAHTPAQLRAVLAPLGWVPAEWWGVRVFSDHLDEPAPAEPALSELLAAEAEAAGRDPYRQVAALLHLTYRLQNL